VASHILALSIATRHSCSCLIELKVELKAASDRS